MEPGYTPDDYRRIWDAKPALRAVYADYFDRLASHCVPGITVEVGGGSGNLKERLADVFSSDIVPSAWVDLAVDAQTLPFADGTVANLVALDALHHFEFPARFFAEAARVLRPGGRVVFIEPAITPLSWPFYKLFHPEPVRMGADPLVTGTPDPDREPYHANQGVPTLLAGRHRRRLEAMFPRLRFVAVGRMSFLAYPLSGGFRRWSLVPGRFVGLLLRLERAIERVLGRVAGFRLLLVLEKQ